MYLYSTKGCDSATQLEVLQSPVQILADRGELFVVKHHPNCDGEQVTIVVTGYQVL